MAAPTSASQPATKVSNTLIIRNVSSAVQRNYPLQIGRPFLAGEIAHCPAVVLEGKPIATQADVKNRYPDGSVKFAVIAAVLPSLPASGAVTLTFQDQPCNATPLSKEALLTGFPDFDATMRLAFTGGATGSASARAMLEAGDCKPWTSGPIATTVECADDTAARKYDLGDGGAYRPFRPRIYATFWPALGKVHVRFAGEAGLATELKDLRYNLTLSLGKAAPQTVYTLDLTGGPASGNKLHWAMSGWTKRFWLGGAPEPKVNIDHNLSWLAATRFVPNYDTTLKIPEAALKRTWETHTTRFDGAARQNQPYDGSWNGQSLWTGGMGAPGGRMDIGPYPDSSVAWLYSGDWRMRDMSLTLADIAAAWPMAIRETDPARRLNRDDPAGSGTGLGLPVSITDRKTLVTASPGYIDWEYTAPGDRLKQIGAIDGNQPWGLDGAHQPAPFFVPYLLTGDKFYLDQMAFWASWSAGKYNYTLRGPDGAYGGINDELRGAGWVLRNRVEVAFMLPDGDPLRRYFETLTVDALARWEGSFGIANTALDSHPAKPWGAATGVTYAYNYGPNNGKPPPLHNWESNGTFPDLWEQPGITQPGKVATMTSPWMQYYNLYGLGRARELGYPAGPLFDYTARWLVDLILKSGKPEMLVVYQMPVEKPAQKTGGVWTGGGYFDWTTLQTEAFTASFLSTGLPEKFRNHLTLTGEGYSWIAGPAFAYAAAAGVPGADAAWAWYVANVRSKLVGLADNPKWAALPRSAP